jgi:hypothetical protein
VSSLAAVNVGGGGEEMLFGIERGQMMKRMRSKQFDENVTT